MDFFEEFNDPTYDPIEYGEYSQEAAEKMSHLWRIKPLYFIDFRKGKENNFEFSTEKKLIFTMPKAIEREFLFPKKPKKFFKNWLCLYNTNT